MVVARKTVKFVITGKDLDDFEAWDTSIVWTKFPQHMDVLTVHGLQDKTVPPWVNNRIYLDVFF